MTRPLLASETRSPVPKEGKEGEGERGDETRRQAVQGREGGEGGEGKRNDCLVKRCEEAEGKGREGWQEGGKEEELV